MLIQGELKPTSQTLSAAPSLTSSLDKLNNFLFQYCLYFCANSMQFNTNIAKIKFAVIYFTGVTQDWNLFVDKLC